MSTIINVLFGAWLIVAIVDHAVKLYKNPVFVTGPGLLGPNTRLRTEALWNLFYLVIFLLIAWLFFFR
jgi:hypothetical protein